MKVRREQLPHASFWEATGFGESQHSFDEATARFALCAEREFAVDHRGADGVCSRVVCRRNALNVGKRSPRTTAMLGTAIFTLFWSWRRSREVK